MVVRKAWVAMLRLKVQDAHQACMAAVLHAHLQATVAPHLKAFCGASACSAAGDDVYGSCLLLHSFLLAADTSCLSDWS